MVKRDYLELLGIVADVYNNDSCVTYLQKLKSFHEDTFLHSLHVASLAVQIGAEYGLSLHRLKALSYGGLLHDFGKTKIPLSVLDKTSALTEDEFLLIQTHPLTSYNIVKNNISIPKGVSREMVELICLMHHLRLDGSGYPTQDAAPEHVDFTRIPTEVRIISVCDIYDALVSKRPYKCCFSHVDAIFELNNMACRGFVDKRFVDILENLGDGNRLLLQEGGV